MSTATDKKEIKKIICRIALNMVAMLIVCIFVPQSNFILNNTDSVAKMIRIFFYVMCGFQGLVMADDAYKLLTILKDSNFLKKFIKTKDEE